MTARRQGLIGSGLPVSIVCLAGEASWLEGIVEGFPRDLRM